MNACLLCERTSDAVPLLTIEFRGNALKICSQHLPILIHDPGQLIGIVEGAEQLEPSAHKD
jgi:hypothetical protein